MKKRILFVDDERRVLEGLQRMLRHMRHEWEMAYAASGPEALEILAARPFDVVVSDMQMPGMNGGQLLARVRECHPNVVRIILSGYSDREMILNSVRLAHQYLAKPCDSETLKHTVGRAFALRDLLKNEALVGLVSTIETLPSAPSVYNQLMDELGNPAASIRRVGEIIAKDMGMTAKILQLANSAFFGLSQEVNTLDRALVVLGFETVLSLVMTAQIFSVHTGATVPGFSISALWEHSMRTAVFAKAIAKGEDQEKRHINDAFMAGLLHDIGKLVLATSMPEKYGQVVDLARATKKSLGEVEQAVFGTTHAEVGAYLMGVWGLPDSIVEAIAFHHSPGKCLARSFGSLTAVHVGNLLEKALHPGGSEIAGGGFDHQYLAELHLADRIPAWETACGRLARQGGVDV